MLTGLVEYLPRLGMKGVCEEGRDTATYRIGCDYQQGYAMPPSLAGPDRTLTFLTARAGNHYLSNCMMAWGRVQFRTPYIRYIRCNLA
jgi:hypothetical protein